MKTLKLKNLKYLHSFVCDQYIQKFCKKQKIQFEGWVGDTLGGVAIFNGDLYFNFDDILLDINTKQPKGNIISWYYDNIDHPENETKWINYKSYTMGLRIKNLNVSNTPQDLKN